MMAIAKTYQPKVRQESWLFQTKIFHKLEVLRDDLLSCDTGKSSSLPKLRSFEMQPGRYKLLGYGMRERTVA